MIDICVNIGRKLPESELTKIMKELKPNGVEGIILTGTSLKSSRISLKQSKNYENVTTTIGVHPHNAKDWDESLKKELEKMLTDEKVVAVGECGLDYDRMFSTKEEQIYAFEQQIELAIKYKKPLFLHEREAHEDFVMILNKYPEILPYSVVHCFTGNKENMQKYLDMGCMIGITGWVCDDVRGTDLQNAVKSLPIEHLMIETDSPWLTPKNIPKEFRGRMNLPKNMKYIVSKLSELMDLSESEIKQKTMENTKKFFKIK